VKVKLSKPQLEDVAESAIQMAWEGVHAPGMPALEETQEEWIEIVVGVELQHWPDGTWLTFWREEDVEWPERFDEPMLDGRKLIFTASEDQLEEAWAALKARVEATNRLYAEHHSLDEEEDPSRAEREALARLRESAQRRIDALD
jgi:hypothetical protein